RASECAVSARSERSEPRSREQDGAVSARSERSEPRSREQDGAVSARSERSEPRSREQDGAVKAADFRARHRGGGLFTETVNQRLGAYLCVPAYRFGLAPTVLTLANLVLGLAAAAGVAVLAGRAPAPLVGLGAPVLWHLAYPADRAHGQLARVTGKASPAGARVDVLCDVALQIALVAAVASAATRYRPVPPAWLVAVFAGTW